jgi:hypothetical protein
MRCDVLREETVNKRLQIGLNAVALLALLVCIYKIHTLLQVRDELIELNHDKSVYIDGGCSGRYQGTEETR